MMLSNETIDDGCRHCAPTVDLAAIRHLVFDMDGTIYQGKTLFPYTLESFAILERCGVGYTYLTNNSSLSTGDYLHKLQGLGLRSERDNLYTSSLATIDHLRRALPSVRSLFLLGTNSLKKEFSECGFEVIDMNHAKEPDAVVVAFDMELSYETLCRAAWWIRQGKPFLATHPDLVCPTDLPTVLVDCGALCACLTAATGRRPDKVPGKPDPSMIAGIMQRHKLQAHEVGMVGDRLYTDMAMARAAGIVGVLVLSGEATLENVRQSDHRPEIIVDNISVLARMIQQARAEKRTA